MNGLIKHNWFKELVEECKSLVVEAEFTSRWVRIVAYHAVGEKIESEKENFEKAGIKNINKAVAEAMNRSTRHIQRCVQFYNKFPNLDKLPGGKAVSWHDVVNKHLPESSGTREERKNMVQCPKCGTEFEI